MNFFEVDLTAQNYLSHMVELMDKPVPYEILDIKGTWFEAKFTIEGISRYGFIASIIQPVANVFNSVDNIKSVTADWWEIEFEAIGLDKYRPTFDITGTGQQFTVFATVAVILEKFIELYSPEVFYFSAKEKSRERLYITFAKQISTKFNYINTIVDGTFIFERK